MAVVRASSKYQVAIPKAIRSKLHIEPGQKLAITETDGAILLTPIPADPAEFLCGMLKDQPSLTQELSRERKRDAKHE